MYIFVETSNLTDILLTSVFLYWVFQVSRRCFRCVTICDMVEVVLKTLWDPHSGAVGERIPS